MPRHRDFDTANEHLRRALNEFKAIDESDTFTDRQRLMNRLDWLSTYLSEGGPAPEAKKIIAEAAAIPVQE